MNIFRRFTLKADPLIDQLIVPPVRIYTGADEDLAARTKAKREAAAIMRQRASAVESGSKVGAVLRMAQGARVAREREG